MWDMEIRSLSFVIRAAYDVLPTATNLHQWVGADPESAVCSRPASFWHVLTLGLEEGTCRGFVETSNSL